MRISALAIRIPLQGMINQPTTQDTNVGEELELNPHIQLPPPVKSESKSDILNSRPHTRSTTSVVYRTATKLTVNVKVNCIVVFIEGLRVYAMMLWLW